MTHPRLTCNQCGTRWQKDHLPDVRKSKKVTWAPWNFEGSGQRWPIKTFKEALLEPPPGLHGGQRGKKAKKAKQPAIHKALKDHWDHLPTALKEKCQAMGVVEVEAPATPDLPTLIKEHLQSLPTDLKEAVEKIGGSKSTRTATSIQSEASCGDLETTHGEKGGHSGQG